MISGLFLCELFSILCVQLFIQLTNKIMENQNENSWSIKNIIILLFTIEQLLIIYIIASKKGISLIDWFSNLF
jgi:hypothetical protein